MDTIDRFITQLKGLGITLLVFDWDKTITLMEGFAGTTDKISSDPDSEDYFAICED